MKTKPRSSLAAMVMLAAVLLAAPTTASTQTFTTLTSFTNFLDGTAYIDTGLTLSDGILYGTGGTIYKVSTNGSGFAVVHQFTGGSEGLVPVGRVSVSGNTIYGVTRRGGIINGFEEYGIIYRVNTDGSDFTVLHRFNKAGGDGYWPAFGLILSGSTLYGTTLVGGAFGDGVVFKINTNGTGYQNLHSFNFATDGAQPQCELTLIGNTLFGTTAFGSLLMFPNGGMLFKIGLDGAGFAVLYTFSNLFPVQNEFLNRLTPVGDTLCGVGYDVNTDQSSLYIINTNGTGFQIIHQLPTGSSFGGVLTWTGSALLGSWHDSASSGGDPSGGIFQVDTDGTGYHVINTFAGTSAYAADLVFSGTTLYGGRFDFDFGLEPSALFSLDLRPRLAITTAGAGVNLSWPSYAHDYGLEQNSEVAATGWTNVTAVPLDDGTNWQVTLPVPTAPAAAFHRLRRERP
jgi:uncharacterized repeat protein (TIGR03803 family)